MSKRLVEWFVGIHKNNVSNTYESNIWKKQGAKIIVQTGSSLTKTIFKVPKKKREKKGKFTLFAWPSSLVE